MAQGEFTKEEILEVRKSFDEILEALPKSKLVNYLGHANDVYLFLAAADKVAPSKG